MTDGTDCCEEPTFGRAVHAPTDPAHSAAVEKFFDWAFKNGGTIAHDLDYIALPTAVQDAIRASWKSDIKS